MYGTNARIFAIACSHLPQEELRAAIVDKFMEVTGGQIPTYSLKADYPDVLEAAKRGFVFMDFNPQINPEVLITDDHDFTEAVVQDTAGCFLEPALELERNAVMAVQGLLTYIKETRNGLDNET